MNMPYNTFIMDRIERVTECSLETGMVNWTTRGIGSPSLELSGETVEKTDAYGALMAQIDTAKNAALSGELDTINITLLAAQRGAKIEVGTESAPITVSTFDVAEVRDGKATLKFTPKSAPAYVYPINSDQTQGEAIEVGLEDTNAKIDGNIVTLPEGFAASSVGVLYDYESASDMMLTDSSETFGTAAKYIVRLKMRDICTDQVRYGSIVFNKAKLDNNVTLNLTTEGTHPFTINAQKEYCADEAKLYYWVWETK